MEDHFKDQPNPNLSGPPTSDEKTWALFSHLGFVIGGFITPLIIYLVKKHESRFVAQNAANALNWGLTLMMVMFLAMFIFFIILFGSIASGAEEGALIAIIPFYILIFGIAIFNIVVGIRAIMKANSGEIATYPFSIRFVKP